MIVLNAAGTRLASDEHCAFGFACYEGETTGETFEGRVVANVGSPEDAQRWIDTGEIPEKAIRPHSPDRWTAP